MHVELMFSPLLGLTSLVTCCRDVEENEKTTMLKLLF